MNMIKTTHRNRLEFEDDVRCALAETSLMDKLVKNKQHKIPTEFD